MAISTPRHLQLPEPYFEYQLVYPAAERRRRDVLRRPLIVLADKIRAGFNAV